MMESTLKKFGYPGTLIKEYRHWRLLCRYAQVTLGSLILIYKEEISAFSQVSPEGFLELATIVPEVEVKLKNEFQYEKINWVMYMMKDPEVHFHIIPRYPTDKEFEGISFKDSLYPSAPRFLIINEIGSEIMEKLILKLQAIFSDHETR